MARDLTRIGEKARQGPKCRFTSIYHFVTDRDHLRACYEGIDPDKATGVDGVTREEYGKKLERNLDDLARRLSRMGYRPQPVRRVYIPTDVRRIPDPDDEAAIQLAEPTEPATQL